MASDDRIESKIVSSTVSGEYEEYTRIMKRIYRYVMHANNISLILTSKMLIAGSPSAVGALSLDKQTENYIYDILDEGDVLVFKQMQIWLNTLTEEIRYKFYTDVAKDFMDMSPPGPTSCVLL